MALQLITEEPQLKISKMMLLQKIEANQSTDFVNQSPFEHLLISWDINFISTLWPNFG